MIQEILKKLDLLNAGLTGQKAPLSSSAALQQKLRLLKECRSLTPEEKLFLARHPHRPKTDQYIHALFTDFFEQKGGFADASILGGIALYKGHPVTVIGYRKGSSLKENMVCNFGVPGPEGYAKVLHLLKQAEKFGRPVITFIDTPTSGPHRAPQTPQLQQALASCMEEAARLTVPVVAVLTGECSGTGTLALGGANRILMLENAAYALSFSENATAEEMFGKSFADQVIPEPLGGAQLAPGLLFASLDAALEKTLLQLKKTGRKSLTAQRRQKLDLLAR